MLHFQNQRPNHLGMAIYKICLRNNTVSNPSWFWEESVTCEDLCLYWQYSTRTDFSQNPDGLLAEP